MRKLWQYWRELVWVFVALIGAIGSLAGLVLALGFRTADPALMAFLGFFSSLLLLAVWQMFRR